jgi:hypothetical protein
MTYPMGAMGVGDTATVPGATKSDIKRTCRNVSQYGIRNEKHFICRTANGITTITRMR